MINYYYGNPEKQDWTHVANIFAAHEALSSEHTSSLPLVQFWKKDKGFQDRVKDLQSKLGNVEIMTSDSKLCFEYGVSVPTGFGRGKASMTDLMIISEDQVIAIEAKYTEYLNSQYEPLDKWLKDSKADGFSRNKIAVLAGWLKYIMDFGGIDILHKENIQRFVEDFIQKEEMKNTPYQLIHRIASACAVAKEKSFEKVKVIIVYQLFYDHDQNMTQKMKEFSKKLQTAVCTRGIKDVIKFYVVGVEARYEKEDEKPERLNDLFLEMQKDIAVYSFGPASLLWTNQKQ